MPSEVLTLTSNDVALAEFACAHAINWCKKQGRSKYWKNEVAKYTSLSRKLATVLDTVHPVTSDADGTMVLDVGDEEILRLDMKVVTRLQRKLIKAGAVR